MKPDDRIRVLAPVGSQVAAFAVVLILGLLFGHHSGSPRHKPSPSPTSPSSPTPKTKAPGLSFPLGVQAVGAGNLTGDKLVVFSARTHARVGTGRIGSNGYTVSVKPGSYEVCVQIPKGDSITPSSIGLHKPEPATRLPSATWRCATTPVGATSTPMIFNFAKAAPPSPTPPPSRSPASSSPSATPTTSAYVRSSSAAELAL